jgi:predicted permease
VITSFALTVLIVSLVAARALPARNAADLLKSGSGKVIGSLKTRRVLNVLVVCELALAVILLVEAGLMIRSFWALRYRDLGFRPEQLLTLRVDLTSSSYSSISRQRAFFENLLQRVGALPGVDAVAFCSSPPPVPVGGIFRLSVEGDSQSTPGPMIRVQVANTDYFRILGIPLVKGEMFADQGHDSPTVVIINRALARQHLDEDYAVGEKIRLGGPLAPWLTIVGIVEDFKNVGLAAETEPEAYRPYQQFPLLGSIYVLVRSSTSDPLMLVPAIRREVATLDSEQPLAEIQTLDQRLTASVAQQRFVMSMLVCFAVLALLLAVVGIYGIMSYVSQQRKREIAIRMALGAQQKQVVWMMVREGLLLGLFGAALGIAGARAASHILSSMFYGVAPSDPYTFVIVLVALVFTTVFACYLTARRVARVEPLEVLRYE